MKVKNMSLKDFDNLCKARKNMGQIKYGDAHKERCCAKDTTEEIADIRVYLDLRKEVIQKSSEQIISRDKKFTLTDKINRMQKIVDILFLEVVEFDKIMKATNYIEKDISRIYFDEVNNDTK